jgi:hypothetical protein
LLAEAGKEAEARGLTVLNARGAALEGEYPFGGAHQLLDSAAVDQASREMMLAGAGRAAEPVLTPGTVFATAPYATFAVLHGLFWALANLTVDRPLLVSVDDVQWADESSVRFLDFLARRLDELPVMLLLAWRPGESSSGTADRVLAELEADSVVSGLEPAPLSERAVLELTRATLPGSGARVRGRLPRADRSEPVLRRRASAGVVRRGRAGHLSGDRAGGGHSAPRRRACGARTAGALGA